MHAYLCVYMFVKPGYLELPNPVVTISENVGTFRLNVVRVGGQDGEIRIRYKTVDDTATATSDYGFRSGELVFKEGVTLQQIPIDITNDYVTETRETFRIELFDPTAARDVINFRGLGGRTSTIITIVDDDMKPGYLELEQLNATIRESYGTLQVTVVRLGGTEGILKMKYRTRDGTAIAGSDYQSTFGDLVFKDEEKRKTVSIVILNDKVKEITETFHLQIYDVTAGPETINFRSLGTKFSTLITIIDDDMKPGYFELPNPVVTISENIGTFRLNVVRVGGQDGEIRIRYKTVEDTATATSDYGFRSGELVFKEGVTLQQISIDITNDYVTETRETFRIELFDPTAATDVINFRGLGDRTSTIITIVDDDMKPGYLELEQLNATVRESYGTLQVTVVRLGGTEGILKMKYRTRDGTAIAGSDYQSTFGDLVFKDSEKRKTVSIVILNDKVKEITETFHLQIYDVTAGPETINFRSLGSKFSTLITIIDDDQIPGYIEMGTPSIDAPESVGAVLIPVKRIGGSDGVLRVRYITLDVTALAGSDYMRMSDVIVFEDGEIRKMISIPIIDDQFRERVKTFQVQLLDLNQQLGLVNFRTLGSKLTTIVTIIDDDEKPGLVEFEKSSLTIREDAGVAQITLLRVGGTDGTLLVKYKTVPGTAIAVADFVLADGELFFADGVDKLTLSINIVDDKIKEPTENFRIILYEPGELLSRRLGKITSISVNITDNDINPGVLEFQNVRISISENVRTLSITIIRREGTDGVVTLQIRTIGGTATEGVDYNPPPPTVIFPDGVREQSVQLRILDDNIKESDEIFYVGIFNPTSGGILGRNKQLTVVIIDNDEPSVIRFERRSGRFRESDGFAEIPVIREKRFDKSVSVYWKIEDRSATPGEDYRRSSGDLITFSPNQRTKSIRVELMDDTQVENNEFFDVVLYYPSEGAVLGIPSKFTVELLDDDIRVSTQPPVPNISYGNQVSFRSQNIRVKENAGEVIIGITRSGVSLIPITIQIITEDGTAFAQIDYKRTRGPVSFEDGDRLVTIAIGIIDNNLRQPDRTFRVLLLNLSPGILLGLKVVTVTIEDDDGDIAGRRDGGASAVARPRPYPKPATETYRSGLLTKCPDHLILKTCANTCPPTCSSMYRKAPCSFGGCIRGCFCPEGLVKVSESSDRCIRPSECPGGAPRRERQPSSSRPVLGGLLY